MATPEFIWRLSLAQGVGLIGKHKLLAAAESEARYDDLTLLAARVGLDDDHATRLVTSFYSPTVSQQLEQNARVPHLFLGDADYPSQLAETATPPLVLYYQGDASLLNQASLAVVGSRQLIGYAKQALTTLLTPAVVANYPIVSGLARGVDGEAHVLTLQQAGRPIGVIGCGLDVNYPPENAALQTAVAAHGVVVTEYPLTTRPLPYHFPERNRIIAGLSKACLVITAEEKSGSLITANQALQENRNVLAVPGLINMRFSRGCNQLIAAGARPALTATDLVEELVGV